MRRKNKQNRQSVPVGAAGSPASKALFYTILVLVALIYLFPFVIQIGTSFKTDPEATANALNPIPKHFTTAAYQQLAEVDFPLWFMNSAIIAVTVTIGRVLFDSLAGYALSRLHFAGRKFVLAAMVAIMAVPGVVLLIPKFLVLKQLGIYNSYPGMIIPLLVDATGVFIMKQFFDTVSPSIEEAARIDGASTLRTFWSVMLPMAVPALITITVFSFQGSWNEFSQMLVARSDPKLNTLTTGVAALTGGQLGSGNRYPLKLAAALVMTIPVAIMYMIFQKRIVRGANDGAVKG